MDNPWTLDTLLEHMRVMLQEHDRRDDTRFLALERQITVAFDARDKQLTTAIASINDGLRRAELASDKRLELLDGFRRSLENQAAGFVPRAEYMAAHAVVAQTVDEVKKTITLSTGKMAGINTAWALIAGGMGLLLGFVSLLVSFYYHTPH